jgi:hypothetical protein
VTLLFGFSPVSLGDKDDDVRSVAATCLLPVTAHLVAQLPDSLERVLVVLWNCLREMKDDLSSSVGAAMDLLGMMTSYWVANISGMMTPREACNIRSSHHHPR